MNSIKDMIAEGVMGGWRVTDASSLEKDLTLVADVAILGSGAGGGMAAEVLTQAGLTVVLLEEGPLRSSSDFKMKESVAYQDLYQEVVSRRTRDKAITILQGRSVGGSTTVNWTSSFDTPQQTLDHWAQVHGVEGCSLAEMEPWFQRVRQRLHIGKWTVPPNENNEILRRGTQVLGFESGIMDRNVLNCLNSGYCGMGCPANAKQGMLLTTIPTSLDNGAHLVTRARAMGLTYKADRITQVQCEALDHRGVFPTGKKVVLKVRHVVASCGSIGTPALLKRAGAPDPHDLLGKRTFIHPVVISSAIMPDAVNAFYGAPQSVYSDEFLWKDGVTGPMGYKLEVVPLHPSLTAGGMDGHGEPHSGLMKRFAHMHAMLVLLRDGFHEQSQGGTVHLRDDGTPVLDYPFNDYLRDGMRRAMHTMVDIQFAAGAQYVMPMHRHATTPLRKAEKAHALIDQLAFDPLLVRAYSAHVMGGCPMGSDARRSVVDSLGNHHQLENLSIIDGSVFPTCIGANPQVSVYSLALKNATALAARLDKGEL